MDVTQKCSCDSCTRDREWKKRGVPADVLDYVLDLEADAEYYRALKDGNWYNGEEILQNWLSKYE